MKLPFISVTAPATGATFGLRLLYPAVQDTIRGFDPASQSTEVKWEQQARAIPDPARMRNVMERLSSQAHLAGTPQSRQTAEYLLAQELVERAGAQSKSLAMLAGCPRVRWTP